MIKYVIGMVVLVGTLLSNEVPAATTQKLLVASYLQNAVYAFDPTTGQSLGTFISSGSGGIYQPGELAIGPDNDLYVSCQNKNGVYRFDGNTGAFISSISVAAPRGIAFGPDGLLYVSSTGNNAVLRFDPSTGLNLGVFASIGGPIGLTFGPDGNIYVASASSAGNDVMRFDGKTGVSLGVFASGHLDNPQAICFGPDGNLYVNSQYDSKIVKYNGTTGLFDSIFVQNAPPYVYNPSCGIVFGPDGNFYSGNLTGGSTDDGVLEFNGKTGAFIKYLVPGNRNLWSTGIVFTPVPEPSILVLFGIGVIGLLAYGLRWK